MASGIYQNCLKSRKEGVGARIFGSRDVGGEVERQDTDTWQRRRDCGRRVSDHRAQTSQCGLPSDDGKVCDVFN